MGTSLILLACTNPLGKQKDSANQSSPGKVFVGVSSVVPSGGPLAGGTRIRILGQGFNVDSKVKLGALDCLNIAYISIDEMNCTTPGPQSVSETFDVIVTNPNDTVGTLTGGFTYRPAPTVTSISPTLGKASGGTVVTITGSGFVAAASIHLGGAACNNVSVVSPTSITCTTTAHAAGFTSVTVTNVDSQSATLSNAFEFRVAPAITSISPSGGNLAGGTFVTISGSSFQAGITISIGGSACTGLTLVSAATLTCTTTSHAAGVVDVVATHTNAMTGTLATAYTYQGAPTVTAIAPAVGALAGGTVVTMTGTGFLAGMTATIDGVACTSPSVLSSTSLRCTTPGPHLQGAVSIQVTNADTQSGSMSNAYTYMDPPLAPSTLVAAAKSESSIQLSWTDNATNESEYRLERSTDGTNFSLLATLAANTNTYLNTSLTTDQIYYYRVRAYNLAANSAYSNVASATPIGLHIEVPIELMDTAVTASTSAVAWLRTRTSLNTADYDGTITYRYEVVCSNSSTSTLNVELVNSTGVSVASVPVTANAGVPTRYDATWTPTVGANNYRVQTPAVASGILTCYTARMLVQQVNATMTKIYIPLVADTYNRSDSDNTISGINVDQITATTYAQTQPSRYSIWRKDTSRFADLAATDPWTFEAVVSSEFGSGRVALHNRTTGIRVLDSEITSSSTTPALVSNSFADNAADFTNLDDFEVRIRKGGSNSGYIFALYKAGLWVKLTNLNKAEVYYRVARAVTTTTSLDLPHSRVRVDLDRFKNIIPVSVAHESVGSEPVIGTSDILLRSLGNTNASTSGTDLSNSITNFDSTSTQRIRSGAFEPLSIDNFIPVIDVTSGSFRIHSSFVVISITK